MLDTVNVRQKMSTRELTYISMSIALISICSWISIPTAVPFTLQTFAIFMTVGVLGGKLGTLAILVYILFGSIGVPVFAGFTGGFGVLFGSTGGYLFGFILITLTYWLFTTMLGKKTWVMATAMIIGMFLCYTFGTIWFMFLYAKTSGPIGLATTLGWCVFPFIIPDLIKISLAIIIVKSVNRYVRL